MPLESPDSDAIRASDHSNTRRLGIFVGILVLLAAGSWPWVSVCTLLPQTYDAAVWIVNGLPSNPTLWEWIFRGPHFIGYRPATALSFTLDSLVWGLNPTGYNLTNLAIHLATACAAGYATLRLAPGLPRWAMLISIGVFLAHPIAVEMAPQVARRSYGLATLFALLALAVLVPGEEVVQTSRASRPDRLRVVLCALAVALATWAHELGIIMVVVLPIAMWLSARGNRVKNLIPAAGGVILAGAIALGSGIVAKGSVGGHFTREPTGVDQFLNSIWYSLKYLLWLGSLIAEHSTASSGWPALVIGIAVVIMLIGLLARPSELLSNRQKRACVTMLVWIAGLIVLFGFQTVWYGRLVYPLAAPWAILLAITVATPAVPIASRWAAWVLIGWLVWHSPLLHGLDMPRKQHWQAVDRVLRQAESDLKGLGEPGYVRLVLPFHRPPKFVSISDELDPKEKVPLWLRAPEVWLSARRRAIGLPPVELTRFLFAEQGDPRLDELPIRYQPAPAHALHLAPNHVWYVYDGGRSSYLDTGSSGYSFQLRDLHWPEDTAAYVYVYGRSPLRVARHAQKRD